MTAAQIDGDAISGYELPGANLGFFTTYPLSDKAHLQMELAWVQKGSRQVPEDSIINSYKARLNYIEIPVLYVFEVDDINLSFEIGPALDILINSTETWNGAELESDPEFNRFNLVGIVGVNYHFSDSFHVNFRTNNSIIPIRPGNAPSSRSPPVRLGGFGQRNLILSFGLYFSFGG